MCTNWDGKHLWCTPYVSEYFLNVPKMHPSLYHINDALISLKDGPYGITKSLKLKLFTSQSCCINVHFHRQWPCVIPLISFDKGHLLRQTSVVQQCKFTNNRRLQKENGKG